MLLDSLALFLHIVEKGSMAAGGREMGLSPTTVSERLAALEAHFGARLLNRTTRSISLTEEGRALMDGAKHLLAEAEELEARVRLGVESLAGPIRISAPSDLGRNRLVPVIDRFLALHPAVSVDLHLADGYQDIAALGLDLALRYGDLDDSSLMVRHLTTSARIVCASPDYLERHGRPRHPSDLERHNCLLMRFGDEADRLWPFRVQGRDMRVIVTGNRTANDGELVRKWCLAGYGIIRKSSLDVADNIAAGRLEPLLTEFAMPALALQAVYPKGRARIRRIGHLIDALTQAFGAGGARPSS